MKCANCKADAVCVVELVSRRRDRVISRYPACAEHRAVEERLAAQGLSMVDAQFKPLPGGAA